MKLLFDQNLSPRLVQRLASLFPASTHVSLIGLDRAFDHEVWEHARINDFIVVTKDADYSDLSLLRSFPPKVVWLRLGNCSTQQIEDVLRANHAAIIALGDDPIIGVLTLV